MDRVFSLHFYQLKPSTKKDALERAFRQAEEEGLFELPGLERAHLLWGIKGKRGGQPAALWVYRSRQAWQQIWGDPDDPIGPEDYPDQWIRWERDLLDPLLIGDPDKVELTSYQALFTHKKEQGRD